KVVDQLAVGVFLEALQRHGPAGGIADELCQLIPPMRRNRRVGVQRKAVDTGAARPREPGRLTLVTKSGADTPAVLPRPGPEGEAVLHPARHAPPQPRVALAPTATPRAHAAS